jgi:hypothetical protein
MGGRDIKELSLSRILFGKLVDTRRQSTKYSVRRQFSKTQTTNKRQSYDDPHTHLIHPGSTSNIDDPTARITVIVTIVVSVDDLH